MFFSVLMLVVFSFGVCAVAAQEKSQVGCPNIKIIEPGGLATFGDTVDFRLDSDLQQRKDIQIDWKISAGKIEKGQGTASIVVRTNSEASIHAIYAQATVKGLPKECVSVFEGTAIVGCCIDPILLDEYGKVPSNDQKGRLDNILHELRENPKQVGLIILRTTKGSSEEQLLKRVKFIKDFIFGYRKFPKDRIVIASDPEPYFHNAVRIYRVPIESVDPLCRNCRIH